MSGRLEGEPGDLFLKRVRWEHTTVEVGGAEPSPVRTAWADWLGRYPWEAWGTLTFKWPDPTEAQLDRAFARFVRYIGRSWDRPPCYFLGHEVGRGGRAHLHCLLGGFSPTLQRTEMWRWWFDRFGRCEVRGYDPEKGAAAYVSKYITKELGHYDVDLRGFAEWHRARNDGPTWKRMRGRRG